MLWRLVLVLTVLVVSSVLVILFSDSIFSALNDIWQLDESERKKVVDWAKVVAVLVSVLGAVFALIGLVIRFIKGKQEPQPPVEGGNGARFYGKVKIGGDFVNGDKNINPEKHNDGK